MGQAVLQTARIRLVPLGDEHLEHEVELDADPEVMRHLSPTGPRTREEVERLHPGRLAEATPGPGGFWVGLVDGEPVGWWCLGVPDREELAVPGQAELGYRLLRRHWRRGLAVEGARELLRHGFDDLGLHRVVAETRGANAGSRAVLRSLGMEHVRTHTDGDERLPGPEQGDVEYALTVERWRALPTA